MNALGMSLETAAARCADPTPEIHARLFSERPVLEAVFQMEKDGGVCSGMPMTGRALIRSSPWRDVRNFSVSGDLRQGQPEHDQKDQRENS
jgi:hypothetical protein